MKRFSTVINEVINRMLITESVSVSDVNNAIDTHTRVIINYHSRGEDIATGARIIEVYAYGVTKAGNPVIRAFQPYGDTTSRVPSWKFFRLDRISFWKPTKQVFSEPASDRYHGIGRFNPKGDKTMANVYKIATFNGPGGNTEKMNNIQPSAPKLKQNNQLYKTDTEKGMERLRQQLKNPIKLSDIKTKQGFRTYNNNMQPQNGPKTKGTDDNVDVSNYNSNDMIQQTGSQNVSGNNNGQKSTELYKTDTERGMENLRKQLENPRYIDLSKIPRR